MAERRRPLAKTKAPTRAAISDAELSRRLFLPPADPKALAIVPMLGTRVEGGTIDVRLGTKFIVLNCSRSTSFEPLRDDASKVARIQDKVSIGFEEEFVLHPGQLLLASTLEYMGLPLDLSASVVTRSTFGRAGLVGATAVHVHPGYRGCLTLELVNLGEVPITLHPGVRVAQLVFYQREASSAPASRYSLATGPEFPKPWLDPDLTTLEAVRQLLGASAQVEEPK